jgi:HTH-type transcriptional regulator / antitoxin HipB
MANIKLRTAIDIGALIRDRRRAFGIDQAELAQRVGVSRLWVNQVERGKSGASIALVLRALGELGVELTGLYDKSPQPTIMPEQEQTVPDINKIISDARRIDRS